MQPSRVGEKVSIFIKVVFHLGQAKSQSGIRKVGRDLPSSLGEVIPDA